MKTSKKPKLQIIPKGKGKTRIAKILEQVLLYQWGDLSEQEATQRFIEMMKIENEINPYGLTKVYWDK